MDLEKVTAKIRPRRGWEAIDLGISLVQSHAAVLFKVWFIVSLPLYLLLLAIFAGNPQMAIVLFWWLLPLLERPLLFFLSRELFGEQLSTKECVKSFFSLAKIQWFMSLTVRRFSFTRSFDLPLVQLEALKGNERTKRLRVIHSGDSGSAVWLTVVFLIVESIMYFSVIALIYLMIPEIYLENFNFWDWVVVDTDSNLIAYVFNFLMYLAISLVTPFYVACGFALYLNQRTHLEAWDIELAFKRLAARLSEKSSNIKIRLASLAPIGILIFATNFTSVGELQAQQASEKNTFQQTENEKQINWPNDLEKNKKLSEVDWKENLDLSNLSHSDAKKMIEEIKQGRDFHQKETIETNQYRSSDDPDEEQPDRNISPIWLVIANILALLIEFALWIFIAVLLIFLILKYKYLLVRGVSNKKTPPKRPQKLFGLDLNSESLPEKPWFIAKQMIEKKQYREALSLLYRASLIWYIDNSDAIIKEGYTELECLKRIKAEVNQHSHQYMALLTNCWRELAYAHQVADIAQLNSLCDNWPKIMRKMEHNQPKKADNNVAIQPKKVIKETGEKANYEK